MKGANIKNAPLEEIPVDDLIDQEARTAKAELQAVLDELKPTANKKGDSKKRENTPQKGKTSKR